MLRFWSKIIPFYPPVSLQTFLLKFTLSVAFLFGTPFLKSHLPPLAFLLLSSHTPPPLANSSSFDSHGVLSESEE
jgi:hypothetical protein